MRTGEKVAVALLAALAAFLLRFPMGGTDTQPPDCYHWLMYPVPCHGGVPFVAAAATGILVFAALWWRYRRPDA